MSGLMFHLQNCVWLLERNKTYYIKAEKQANVFVLSDVNGIIDSNQRFLIIHGLEGRRVDLKVGNVYKSSESNHSNSYYEV